MRKILFVVALAVSAVGVESMRADAGCGGVAANPCGGGAVKPPQAKAGLKIPYVAPRAGESVSVDDTESMDATLTFDGKTSPLTQSMTQAFTKTIVSVKGDVVTKVKLKFSKAHAAGEQMGMKQDADLPVKGKAYVADATSGTTKLTTDAGAALDNAAEKAIVAKATDDVGVPDKFSKLMAAKTFVVGEKAALSADEIKALIPADDNMKMQDVSLTLMKNDGKLATFELDGSFSGQQGPTTMNLKFSAQVIVDIKKSRPLEFDMTGQLTGNGEQGGKKIAIAGKMTAKRTMSYK